MTDLDKIRCKKCKQDLPVSEFYFRKETGKYRGCCKKCKSIRTKAEILSSLSSDSKTCTHCGVEKNKSDFQKAGGGRWLQPYCKECDSKRKKQWSSENHELVIKGRKQYYLENKEAITKRNKAYDERNREAVLMRKRVYAEKTKSIKKIKYKEYRNKNKYVLDKKRKEHYYNNHKYYLEKGREARRNRTPEQIEAKKKYDREYKKNNKDRYTKWRIKNADRVREQKRIWSNNKSATDIQYRIKKNLRTRIRCALKPSNAYKVDKSENLLGCKIDFYRNYIQSLFTDGMSWERFLAGEIEIDHIKPCVLFNLTIEEEQRRCFHYTNTQPLWAVDNMKKGIKYKEAA
jgi:hypothetical protein